MSMSEAYLPPQWAETSLGEIADVQGGIQKGKKRSSSLPLRDVPYLRVANVQRGYLDLDVVQSIQATDDEISQLRLQVGDVLFNEGGDRDKLGRGWIWTGALSECIHQNHVFRARLIDRILDPRLLSWYGNTVGQQYFFDEGKQTTNLASLNSSKLKALPVLVPPHAEQIRIVEAIESYLTRLDDAFTTLERVQRNLKRYRASVLKAAVEGRLVPTEAELARAEGREFEPASVLLERILAERRRRWEEAELAKMKAKGKAKYVEPAGPDMSELPELPEGWCWVRTEQCIMTQVGHAFSSKEFIDEGVNLLRGDNIGHGTLRWGDNRRRCIRPEALKVHAHLELKPGDIVLAMDRPIISTGLKFAHVRPLDLPALLVQRVIRLRTSIHLGYFEANLQSQSFLNHLNAEARGGGVPHVSEDQIKNFTFPLPPLAEQARIAQEIERLMSTYESSTQIVMISERRVSRLCQSILKWAFEGRLVDQDPNDEPAAVLLERIRAERAAGNGKKQPRPRRVNTRSASA